MGEEGTTRTDTGKKKIARHKRIETKEERTTRTDTMNRDDEKATRTDTGKKSARHKEGSKQKRRGE